MPVPGCLFGSPVIMASSTPPQPVAEASELLCSPFERHDESRKHDLGAIRELNGAVNDARIIAEALNKRNADEVVLLLDGAATRERIFAEARRLAEAAARQSGWLIITYAGHGGQETERIAGDEEDGLDEVFLLSGFNTKGKQSGQRIVDNEIFALLSAVPKGVNVLFVADSCHSGTMTRDADPRAGLLSRRFANYGPIENDALPPLPVATKGMETTELEHVIFVAGAKDSEAVQEVFIDGVPHGAVSYFLSRSILGDIDGNGRGASTMAEFRQMLVLAADMANEQRQGASVNFLPGRGGEPWVFATRPKSTEAAARVVPAELTLAIIGDGVAPAGVKLVQDRQQAMLIWDVARGQVVANGLGDQVAEKDARTGDAVFIAGVTDKWRALPGFRALATSHPLAVTIGQDGAQKRYASGRVPIGFGGNRSDTLKYLTAFNIAGDGTIQSLFPRRSRPAEGEALSPDFVVQMEAGVQPPFGADHIIAIATAARPDQLRQRLATLEGKRAAGEALAMVQASLSGSDYALGIAGLYTGPLP